MPEISLQGLLQIAQQQHQAGKLQDAESLYQQILARDPVNAAALHMLGVLSLQLRRHEAAEELIRKALAIQSHFPDAYNNLGIALRGQGRYEEALSHLGHALSAQPEHLGYILNLGITLLDSGRLDEAILQLERVIATEPKHVSAHWNLAIAYLLRGDWPKGWQEYEWRWNAGVILSPRREFRQAKWEGGDLGGRRILLHAEQGMGDTMQFVRYAPLVAQRVGKVILECQPPLKRLLERVTGVERVVVWGEPLPEFDVHCPLGSLPKVFGTTLENVPDRVPYLRAEDREAQRWRERMAEDHGRLKVGLVWAGNPKFRSEALRSPGQLSTLAALAKIGGVSFYSLQKDAAGEQARTPPAGMSLVDWTSELQDFAATAALIENLDLVISSDTAVAHLAGAMGKNVWTMLPFAPDWRWMLKRNDSPWYPTMRLFRQERVGDWESVAQSMAQELAKLVEGIDGS